MIAFLIAVADPERYAAIAAPALERVREADSVVMPVATQGPPQPALNAALDELAGAPDLEAVVVLHEDARLLDLHAASIVRSAFAADPDLAIAGVMGAQGVRGLAAWRGAVSFGRVLTPHAPAGEVCGVAATGEVACVDGVVLCLSPWAVRTLRFDEDLAEDFHGYDVDICFQARYHGRRVAVIELGVAHDHRPRFEDPDGWVRNELRFQRKWIDHRLVSERRHQALSPDG